MDRALAIGSSSWSTPRFRKGTPLHIDYTINTVSSEKDLARVIDLVRSVLGSEHPHNRCDFWLPHYRTAPDLLIYAGNDDHLLGCVLARLDGNGITVGIVAVSPDQQRCSIGTALMKEIENRARDRHVMTLHSLRGKMRNPST